jgi:hypothetical protein
MCGGFGRFLKAASSALAFEVQSGFEDGHAGAYERACDVKAILGKELIKIIPGNAARNFCIVPADEIGVAVAEGGKAAVDFPGRPQPR